MITISYITPELYNEIEGKNYTEYAIFGCLQDDVTQEYYLPRMLIERITEAEYVWFRFLPVSELPDYEYYKFKH